MARQTISTKDAPSALGTYSQAVRAGNTVYVSGQLGLDPASGDLLDGPEAQTERAFANLLAVAKAAGGDAATFVKLNVYLVDLAHFGIVNETMSKHFSEPFPARAAVQVAALPKGGLVEVEGVMVFD